MAGGRTHRFDARIDAETDARVARAAAITQESVSGFVSRAARAEADCVLGRADMTFMPAEQFDALIGSLDTPDLAPGLAEAAAREQRVRW